MRAIFLFIACAMTALSVAVAAAGDQAAGRGTQASTPSPGEIRVLPVRGNIYLLVGGGGNITASVGKDGVLVVDTGSAPMTEKVLAAVRDLSRRVTASREPMQSCVGVVQGCAWWSSSELLPTIGAPRAPRPIAGVINTSDDADHVAGNAAISGAGRSYGVRNLANTVPGAWVLAHENVTGRLTRTGQAALVATESYFGREKK